MKIMLEEKHLLIYTLVLISYNFQFKKEIQINLLPIFW